MIDLNDFREHPEAYQQAANDKRIKFDVQAFLELDEKRRQVVQETEDLRAKQNVLNKEVPKLQGAEKEQKLAELKKLSEEVKLAGEKLKEVEEPWKTQQLLIPSIPLDCVPKGKDDTDNIEIRTWGEKPEFDFEIKDHVALGKELDIIDIERGVKIAGARSYFLKGLGARMHHALLNYALDFIDARGYTIMEPPHIVLWEAMTGTGYFPGGEDMAYHLDSRDDDHYLIGTSEVPLVSYLSKETLSNEELPKRFSGYSPCYRREAGSYGKDTHGLYRVHQFYKVEQVVVCEADAEVSSKLHQELLGNSEDFLQSLNIPYRVVDVCTGDMGQGQIYKNDIDSWMPSRNTYSETHSCSTLHAFQARRSGLKYKDSKGKKKYCHTLNNTLAASPRILIPLLELNQQKDGTIKIPEVLQPYMGGRKVID